MKMEWCHSSAFAFSGWIRYDSVYLTCSKKLTGSQLSLPHGINKKIRCETKNNDERDRSGPVPLSWGSPVGKKKSTVGRICWKGRFWAWSERIELDRVKKMNTRGKINGIWWNIKINLQKLVDTCGYEFPTDLQNFTQKFQRATFLNTL